MPTLIDDGQTIATYVRGNPGRFDDFYCERRPTLPAERTSANNQANRAEKFEDWDEFNRIYSELVAKKLTWWNVRDTKGNPAPITAESVSKLHPLLWDRLTNIAIGVDIGDMPPDPSPELKAEFERALAAQKAGDHPGDALAEAAAKN